MWDKPFPDFASAPSGLHPSRFFLGPLRHLAYGEMGCGGPRSRHHSAPLRIIATLASRRRNGRTRRRLHSPYSPLDQTL